MVFGLRFTWTKVVSSVFYHLVPVVAYCLYDFLVVTSTDNAIDKATDNWDWISFKTEYGESHFWKSVIAIVVGSLAAALGNVLSKWAVIRDSAAKYREDEKLKS